MTGPGVGFVAGMGVAAVVAAAVVVAARLCGVAATFLVVDGVAMLYGVYGVVGTDIFVADAAAAAAVVVVDVLSGVTMHMSGIFTVVLNSFRNDNKDDIR